MVPTKPTWQMQNIYKCKKAVSYLKLKKSWSKDACKQNYELIPLNRIIWTTLFSNVQFNFKVCLQYYIHTPECKISNQIFLVIKYFNVCLFVAEHGAERDSGVPLSWAVCEKQLRQVQPISHFLVINYSTFCLQLQHICHHHVHSCVHGHGHHQHPRHFIVICIIRGWRRRDNWCWGDESAGQCCRRICSGRPYMYFSPRFMVFLGFLGISPFCVILIWKELTF